MDFLCQELHSANKELPQRIKTTIHSKGTATSLNLSGKFLFVSSSEIEFLPVPRNIWNLHKCYEIFAREAILYRYITKLVKMFKGISYISYTPDAKSKSVNLE